MNKLDRIRGALFGFAIGDALGGTTEFMPKAEIKQQYGYLTDIIGGGVWSLVPGETTDDTAMTLAVAEGIIANPEDPIEEIGKKFLEWEATMPKDIGIATRNAFHNYKQVKNWSLAAQRTKERLKRVAGNGALMRTLPVALAYTDLEKIVKVTKEQAEMTHFDQKSTDACISYNMIALHILNGEALQDAIAIPLIGYKAKQKPDCEPTGYVIDTYRWVLHALNTSKSFEEVVQLLANEGEDSDTTAAIAGGIAGLYYGYEALPKKYLDVLQDKERIEKACQGLYKLIEEKA